jgi:protocatechuate 3,4-dioxygenase beta subunit
VVSRIGVEAEYGQTGGAANRRVVQVREGQQVSGVDVTLLPPAAIAGRVRDEWGEPVEGLTVRALRTGVVAGRTDDRGLYRLHGLPPGAYHIEGVRNSSGHARRTSSARSARRPAQFAYLGLLVYV